MTLFLPATSAGRRALTRNILPTFVVSCFATDSLFAQTTDLARPPVQQPAKVQATQTTAPDTNKSATTTAHSEPEPQAGADKDMSTVEVVAMRPTNQIDRDVYALKDDISVSNASAADILNNVPSVAVDPDGNVTLRGNSNVQIMVNGKRDAQFQGANRGDALNAFPAENIESIEVINVPGAEFGNEGGSGPIINLVLKRNRKPGSRATLNANHGTADRYRHSLNGEIAAGPYSLSANLGISRTLNLRHSESEQAYLDPLTGNVIGSSSRLTNSLGAQRGITLGSTFTYNVGERDQAGASFNYAKRRQETRNDSASTRFGTDPLPTSQYTSMSRSGSPAETFGLGASYDHRSGAPGESLKFDLRYTGQNNNGYQDLVYDYTVLPTRHPNNTHRDNGMRNRILDLSVDYASVVWSTWNWKAGAKYSNSTNNNATNALGLDPATGLYVPVPYLISAFDTDERNAAIYSTLGTKLFANVSVLAGLRGEYEEMDVRQPLLGQENKYYYMDWLPSFYVTKDLSDTSTLQWRMSRRIARPNENNLNPNLVYRSDFYATQGNPDLKSVDNDSYELAYNETFFNVTSRFALFKRRESPVLGFRRYPLPTDPEVTVTSPVNFGANDAVGVDMNFNIRNLLPGLSVNLGPSFQRTTRMRIPSLISTAITPVKLATHRSDAKLGVRYNVGAEQMQLNINYRGPTITGQGTNGSNTMTTFTWRHKLSQELSLNFNVTNVLHTGARDDTTVNELLRAHSMSIAQPRIFTIGLSYQWGGVKGDDRIRNAGSRGVFRGQGGGGAGNRGGGGNGGGGFGGGGGGGAGF